MNKPLRVGLTLMAVALALLVLAGALDAAGGNGLGAQEFAGLGAILGFLLGLGGLVTTLVGLALGRPRTQ